ncbi:MAG: cytochrome P460 family protein, partial [Acidobacteriaceae bacterium]|nr:cytochrome P460 family protein [Acidobacteriaceae bacterium]
MSRTVFAIAAIGALVGIVAVTRTASAQIDQEAAPIYGIKIPPGYRDWTLISVARVGAPLNDMRAKLGNDVATRAFRDGTNPFPDGAIIARLAWNQAISEENNRAFSTILAKRLSPDALQKLLDESFVAGPATNVQFMVKDSTKYASTGGWGFAQFTNGKPDGEDVHKACYACHVLANK